MGTFKIIRWSGWVVIVNGEKLGTYSLSIVPFCATLNMVSERCSQWSSLAPWSNFEPWGISERSRWQVFYCLKKTKHLAGVADIAHHGKKCPKQSVSSSCAEKQCKCSESPAISETAHLLTHHKLPRYLDNLVAELMDEAISAFEDITGHTCTGQFWLLIP